MGPVGSGFQDGGKAPAGLARPYVAFMPTMPQQKAGERMEPPVSVPMAPKARPAATAAPEPLLEPPGSISRFQGLRAGWKYEPIVGVPAADSYVARFASSRPAA